MDADFRINVIKTGKGAAMVAKISLTHPEEYNTHSRMYGV
jgi:hypothetical protein